MLANQRVQPEVPGLSPRNRPNEQLPANSVNSEIPIAARRQPPLRGKWYGRVAFESRMAASGIGTSAMNYQDPATLPPGTKVDQYAISGVLGRGGFGITYLVHDEALQKDFALKEFFPEDLVMREGTSIRFTARPHSESDYRWGLKKFYDEARLLAQFSHTNIVSVRRVFEGNNTAYMLLDFVRGSTLEKWLQRARQPAHPGGAGPDRHAAAERARAGACQPRLASRHLARQRDDPRHRRRTHPARLRRLPLRDQAALPAGVGAGLQERLLGSRAVHLQRRPLRTLDRHLRLRGHALPRHVRHAADRGDVAPAGRRSAPRRAGRQGPLSRQVPQGHRLGAEAAAAGPSPVHLRMAQGPAARAAARPWRWPRRACCPRGRGSWRAGQTRCRACARACRPPGSLRPRHPHQRHRGRRPRSACCCSPASAWTGWRRTSA